MLFELTIRNCNFLDGNILIAVLLGFPIAFTLMAMGVGLDINYYDPARMEHLLDNRIFSLLFQIHTPLWIIMF